MRTLRGKSRRSSARLALGMDQRRTPGRPPISSFAVDRAALRSAAGEMRRMRQGCAARTALADSDGVSRRPLLRKFPNDCARSRSRR